MSHRHTKRVWGKIYDSHKEVFFGTLRWFPGNSKNSLGEQGRDIGFDVL